MKQVKCVITDDEPTACEGLQRYVEKVDFLSLMGVCEDTMQLNTLLQTEQPDLLFLDIEMPYLSGLELLASLAHPPHVIITSAYEQYALKGYELDVTDYLLKPISFDRFLKAVNKVHGLLQQEKWPDEANNFIFVRSDRQMHKVLFKDILVVEGLENYVCIYTESTKLLVRSTMKRMIEALPGGVFRLGTHELCRGCSILHRTGIAHGLQTPRKERRYRQTDTHGSRKRSERAPRTL